MQPYVQQALVTKDIVSGWRFSATLQLRTPLAYLKLHGLLHRIELGAPDGHPPQHGTWVPVAKSNQELGIPLPDLSLSSRTLASQVGPVPADGGDFLQFLIAVRSLVEADMPEQAMATLLQSELNKPQWSGFVQKLGGAASVTKKLKQSLK